MNNRLADQIKRIKDYITDIKPFHTKILDVVPTLRSNEMSNIFVHTLVNITDVDNNQPILSQSNAIHPQNIARVISRALAHEHNYFINRIAFGDGGTIKGTTNITHKPTNTGNALDYNTWDSRIYHEIASKIVDDGQSTTNPRIGQDLGSADINTLNRLGNTTAPLNDPPTIPHVSGPGTRSTDLGLTSSVTVTTYLNGSEPVNGEPLIIDEIGLYTAGLQAISVGGHQKIQVGNKTSIDDTGLAKGTQYSFAIAIDGGMKQTITFTIPGVGFVTYGEMCEYINTSGPNNTSLITGAKMIITNTTNTYPSLLGIDTSGFLIVVSQSTGPSSSIILDHTSWSSHETLVLLGYMAGATLLQPVQGQMAGLSNMPTNPTIERERLLTHLIFDPIEKAPGSTWKIEYTLTISVQ